VKVVALTRTSRRGPSTRYRIEQYRAGLARLGIEVQTLPLFEDRWFEILEVPGAARRGLLKAGYSLRRLLARVAQARAAARGGADVVLIEQQLFPYLPWALERWLWPSRTPVILEFDDAIFLTPGHRRKLERECARARLVIVGNEFLRAFAAPHSPRVVVIPTTVDVPAAAPPRRAPDGTLRVGWIGLRYNLGYLRELAAPLARLSASGVPCELRVISSGPPDLGPEGAGVKVVHRPWSEAAEAAEIADCDVGVMPLPDTPWARGKCALKLLQFMAAGRPVVASPVGCNRELIRDGENGLFAADAAGWEKALRRLHEDPALALRLGDAGRRTVQAGYSVPSATPRLAETYRLGAAAPPAP
jgi:glycosyltransferase involved in cell wall biosynthesis